MNKTLLRIRGFSDITFHGNDHIHDSPSARLILASEFLHNGQVNLFVTSDLSERSSSSARSSLNRRVQQFRCGS